MTNLPLTRWLCCAFISLGIFHFPWANYTWMGSKSLSSPAENKFTLIDTLATIVLCSSPDDVMNVTSVVLHPDPPQKGENLTVSINGMLSEDLNNGSYLMAKVKKGVIKFPQIRFPACDYIVGGCPVAKATDRIDMMFSIPKFTPGGVYEIEAVLYNVEANKKGKAMWSRFIKSWNGQEMQDVHLQTLEEGPRVACIQGSVEL